VVITVLGILSVLLFGALSDVYETNLRSVGKTVQTGDTHGSLYVIERDVVAAERFLTANTISDPSAVTWSYEGNEPANPENQVLIVSTYATTESLAADPSANRSLVYAGPSCNQTLKNNLVYFVSGGNLYRRTIANTTPPCAGAVIAQKQSCVSGNNAAYCQSSDAVLLSGVSSFKIDYYTDSVSSSPLSSQYTPSGQAIVESAAMKTIKITVTTKQRVGATESSIASNLRIVRQN
ncbi:hypothetical protein HY312_03765, partial [Candidatus Saccharibacteria bacterium]|nr:hypothetical protein [Candidatus Saccharibacteria bacterium]